MNNIITDRVSFSKICEKFDNLYKMQMNVEDAKIAINYTANIHCYHFQVNTSRAATLKNFRNNILRSTKIISSNHC